MSGARQFAAGEIRGRSGRSGRFAASDRRRKRPGGPAESGRSVAFPRHLLLEALVSVDLERALGFDLLLEPVINLACGLANRGVVVGEKLLK